MDHSHRRGSKKRSSFFESKRSRHRKIGQQSLHNFDSICNEVLPEVADCSGSGDVGNLRDPVTQRACGDGCQERNGLQSRSDVTYTDVDSAARNSPLVSVSNTSSLQTDLSRNRNFTKYSCDSSEISFRTDLEEAEVTCDTPDIEEPIRQLELNLCNTLKNKKQSSVVNNTLKQNVRRNNFYKDCVDDNHKIVNKNPESAGTKTQAESKKDKTPNSIIYRRSDAKTSKEKVQIDVSDNKQFTGYQLNREPAVSYNSLAEDQPEQNRKYANRWEVPSPPLFVPRPNSREYQFSAPRNNSDNVSYEPPVPSPPPVQNNIPEVDQKFLKIGTLAPKTYTLRSSLPSPPPTQNTTPSYRHRNIASTYVNSHNQTYALPPPSQLNRAIPFINGNFNKALPGTSPAQTLKRTLGGQLADEEYAGRNARRNSKVCDAEGANTQSVVFRRIHPFDELVQEYLNQPPLSSLEKSSKKQGEYDDNMSQLEVLSMNGDCVKDTEWTGASQNYNYMHSKKFDRNVSRHLKEFQEKEIELLEDEKFESNDEEPELMRICKKKKKKKKHRVKKTKVSSRNLKVKTTK